MFLDGELLGIAAAAAHAERVPAHAIVDMLQICAAVAGRPDLGVAFAQWGNIRGYGPLSLLWDHCPTMADAIRVNESFGDLESRAVTSTLDRDGDAVAIRHVLLVPARYGGTQFNESIMLTSHRLGPLILGDNRSEARRVGSDGGSPGM